MASTQLAPAPWRQPAQPGHGSESLVLVGFTGSEASKRALTKAAALFRSSRLVVAYIDQDVLARIAQYLIPGDAALLRLPKAPPDLGRAIVADGVQLALVHGAKADGLYRQTTSPPARALELLADELEADVVVLGRRHPKSIVERFRLDVPSVFGRASRRCLLTVVSDVRAD